MAPPLNFQHLIALSPVLAGRMMGGDWLWACTRLRFNYGTWNLIVWLVSFFIFHHNFSNIPFIWVLERVCLVFLLGWFVYPVLFLQFRKLQGVHNSRVGSIAWNNHILSTAGKKIVNFDTRAEPRAFQTCQGHRGRLCGLKWSPSGRQLASGGDDGLVCIWELSMASSNRWLHRYNNHKGSAKALCWSPVRGNLLASTGGDSDQCILVRNTSTCEVLSMVNTGCQINEILWSIDGKELLSSHGSYDNQLMLWNYPSMTKITDIPGHSTRILFMAQVRSNFLLCSFSVLFLCHYTITCYTVILVTELCYFAILEFRWEHSCNCRSRWIFKDLEECFA